MKKLHSEKWMQTYTGKKILLSQFNVDDIDIEDIAHALSRICRYNGHCEHFYSVAEHSVYVSECCNPEDAKWGLLHDAVEAYIGDMIRPLKYKLSMAPYLEIEDRLQKVVAEKFGLPEEIPDSVHLADNMTLLAEKRDLIPVQHDWGFPKDHPTYPDHVAAYGPNAAKFEFLKRYNELFNK